MGTTSALNDRFQFARKNAFPHVFLSPQQLVNCIPPPADKTQGAGGCKGGDPADVYPYLHENGGVHETCQNYQAKNLYDDFKCDASGICLNCDPKKGCYPMGSPQGENNFTRSFVDEYGVIEDADTQKNHDQMVAEIGTRGPIGCGVCVTPEFENYSGGIFNDTTGCTSMDHEISIAGYGTTDDGVDYWIGRNSWGTYWGEDGWYVQRVIALLHDDDVSILCAHDKRLVAPKQVPFGSWIKQSRCGAVLRLGDAEALRGRRLFFSGGF